MPEGPEIRRTADRLAEAVLGRELIGVEFAFPALRPYQARLRGARIEAITPRGKALLIRFDNGLTLYTHCQLYGRWEITVAGQRPHTRRSLRVVLETAERAILLYSASDIEIWRSDEIAGHPFLQRLGPDVLDPAVAPDAIAARLDEPRFRGRALAGLLLDQGFLAGMGNYLRAEVLFQAGLLPQRRPRELGDAQRHRLAEALLDVPRRSYRARGIQRSGGMREDYLSDSPEAFRFLVFDRAGAPCVACGAAIERAQIGGRRLYWCPHCQR